MSLVDFSVPGLGESISEATIVKWVKADGDYVKSDESVVEGLETDKSTMELPAMKAGVLKIVVRKSGETVNVGDVIAKIDTDGKPAAAAPAGAAASAGANATATVPPSVERIAAEARIDPATITPTGPKGNLTKADALKAAEAKVMGAPAMWPRPRSTARAGQGAGTQVAHTVVGTTAVHAPPPRMAPANGDDLTRMEMTKLRQTIARRLVESQHATASLTTFNEVDMSAVMTLREKYKERFEKMHSIGLGFMSFFAKAVVHAIRAVPAANAQIDGTALVYRKAVHLGIAVSTEKGLMVPVLRNADTMSMAQIEAEIKRLATRAREGKIMPDEMAGGTFTVTNGGVFGSLLSTPILNPPQSGILGMHKIEKRAVVVSEGGKDVIAIRPMMYLALTYDHRIVDGRQSVTFLVKVKEALEDPGAVGFGGLRDSAGPDGGRGHGGSAQRRTQPLQWELLYRLSLLCLPGAPLPPVRAASLVCKYPLSARHGTCRRSFQNTRW